MEIQDLGGHPSSPYYYSLALPFDHSLGSISLRVYFTRTRFSVRVLRITTSSFSLGYDIFSSMVDH